jgi:hypothetical protein
MERELLSKALFGANLLRLSYDAPDIRHKNEQLKYIRTDVDGWHIAVAGSGDLIDWAQNFSAFKWWMFHKTIPGTNYKATSGYVKAARNVLEAIEPKLDKESPIHLYGHSKGGPVAAIAGLMLQKQGYSVKQVMTYAAPRFSVQDIAEPLMFEMPQWVADGDVIPRYPETSKRRNWQHQGRVFHIGKPVDEYFGVVRDGVKAHLIKNYIAQIEHELTETK